MGLSKLSEKCRQCPFMEKCKHKQIEAVGFLEPATVPVAAELMEPLLVPHDYRGVKVAENTTITIDLEELKKQLAQRFNPMSQMFNYGA